MYAQFHDFSSFTQGMVTARGRLFCLVSDGPQDTREDRGLLEKWTLVARDAFNGLLLWKKPMPEWGVVQVVFRPLRFAGLSARTSDAACGVRRHSFCDDGVRRSRAPWTRRAGKEIRVYAGTEGAVEIACEDEVLYAVVAADVPPEAQAACSKGVGEEDRGVQSSRTERNCGRPGCCPRADLLPQGLRRSTGTCF